MYVPSNIKKERKDAADKQNKLETRQNTNPDIINMNIPISPATKRAAIKSAVTIYIVGRVIQK